MHICISKLTIIVSDNGLLPGRRQAIIWTNAGIVLIRTLGTNFSEILGKTHSFSLKKKCIWKCRLRKGISIVSASMSKTIIDNFSIPLQSSSDMGCVSINQKAVSYAATTLGAHLINPVFNFYYVKVFLTRYGVSETWFHSTQIIFMIWNAVNDPLFGYLQVRRSGVLQGNVLSLLGRAMSILWQLMTWLLMSPGHQQSWYWWCVISVALPFIREDSSYLHVI